jgi:hypothetical protein
VVADESRDPWRSWSQMSFYERGGAKVFSAGAFTLAGQATSQDVSPLLDNLWRYMTRP